MFTYVEIELDGVITVKRLNLPEGLNNGFKDDRYNYVRQFFTDLGYKVGNCIRIC